MPLERMVFPLASPYATCKVLSKNELHVKYSGTRSCRPESLPKSGRMCGSLCGAVCTMSLCAFCCEGQGCTSQEIRFGLWKSSGFERQPQKMVSGRLCFVREGARRGASGTGPSFPRHGLRNWNKSFSVALGFLCARRPMCGGAFLR
jgi:hypothetical protein